MAISNIFKPYNDNDQLSDHQWDGYTLILPCISVGNVPQLTVDLLINSIIKTKSSDNADDKDLELFGYIRSSNVYPFAGPDPFSFKGNLFATSIQVFVSKTKKLVIIQQRSPIYKENRNAFYAELSDFVSRHNFSSILLLSSSFDQYLIPDSNSNQRNQFPMKYLAKNLDEPLQSFLEGKLGLNRVKPVDPESLEDDPNGRIHLPGSGSARAYLKWFSKSPTNTKLICLLMYCSEGDNRQHAFKYADKVATLLNRTETVFKLNAKRQSNPSKLATSESGHQQIDEQSEYLWSIPFSWRTMFGDEPPSEIF